MRVILRLFGQCLVLILNLRLVELRVSEAPLPTAIDGTRSSFSS